MKILATILLLCSFGSATTYTVKAGCGGNLTTIQACTSAMAAGDTCVVYAGTYNEVVTVSAGTAGNYKTLQAGRDSKNRSGHLRAIRNAHCGNRNMRA